MTTQDSTKTGVVKRLRTPQQLARLLGPTTLLTFVVGFVLAAYVFTPTATFDWTGELEQFGILRHYGLAIGCLFGLVFLWPVWNEATGRGQQVGLVLLGLGFLISGIANAMATVGIRAGDWAIIGIVLCFPLGLLVYGGGALYQGERQHGGKSLLIGVVYLLVFGGLFVGYQLLSYVGMLVTVGVWATVVYFDLSRQ
jgi:hypothetical protein